MFDKYVKKLDSLDPLIESIGNEELTVMSQFLYDRISHADSYLVFLGETSSGKSSIINGLLSDQVLPVAASPSTGSITEIELSSEVSENQYFAINKNATIESISKKTFTDLIWKPDAKLKRTKLTHVYKGSDLNHLRIFDTPGYGSIVKEHEEVLKDFLPNSDIVVYTVNYKIGVQEEDYTFLGFLRELVREDVEIILLINRCPETVTSDDVRVKEIKHYVSDILSVDPKMFIVKNVISEDGISHATPHCPELWSYVSEILNSESRKIKLGNAFDQYIKDLYFECDSILTMRYQSAKLDFDSYKQILEAQISAADRIEEAINLYVNPTFDDIQAKLPSRIDTAANHASSNVISKIEVCSTTSKQQMVSYTNAHLLPHCIQDEAKTVQEYIEMRMDELNNQVDDYIQKEIVRFNDKVSIVFKTNLQNAGEKVTGKIVKEIATNSLRGYFASMGGAAGANAGIANAASHLLKKAGNLFNHTFERATHNALKSTLAKIGATSMKAVGAVLTVIIEFAFIAWDLVTWKNALKDKVGEGISKWAEETKPEVYKDIEKLRAKNIETLRKIADEIRHSFEPKQSDDLQKCERDFELSQNIGKANGFK